MLKEVNMPFFFKVEKYALNNLDKYLKSEDTYKKNIILCIDKYINSIYGENIYRQLIDIYNSIKIIEIEDSTLNKCLEISSYVINNNYEIIIGIGGGKTLDVSKYTAYITKKICINIPTSVSHDGIASPIAVLKCENNKVKSLGCNVPSGIIIDLDIISKSPKNLIKAGIGDIVSNYTAIKDWKLSNQKKNIEINDIAILMSELAFKSIINHQNKDINNIDFIKCVIESCIISGISMNISNSSRPCSGSEHLISHAIDMLEKDIQHGIQVAVATIIATYLHGEDPKAIIDFLKIFEIPTTLEEINISKEEYFYIMRNAKRTRPERYTILDEIDMSDESLNHIYNECFTQQQEDLK